MKISPRELREAQIPSKAFGFNQDVVDALLERAADTIEGLIEENRQLFEALERMRSEGSTDSVLDPFAGVEAAAPPEPEPVVVEQPAQPETVAPAASIDESLMAAQMGEKEDLINKTLLLAQKTADETLKTANEQAAQLIETSEKQAQELVAQAKEKAESLTGQAKEKAQMQVTQAEQSAAEMVEKAKQQAEELVATAQSQADSIHAKERDEFVALVTKLSNERAQLISDIELLQGFDEEHRNKLRDAVQEDLAKLETRERIDIGSLPELPIIEEIVAPAPISQTSKAQKEPQVVAASHEDPKDSMETFDSMLDDEPVVAPAQEDDDVEIEFEDDVIEGEIEAELVGEAQEDDADETYDSGDPFAAFVDSPSVVAPAGEETPDSGPQVVDPADEIVDSSTSHTGFDPSGSKKASRQSELDDDDFFASLREAVADDAPLGPTDGDDDDDPSRFKGLFKK